MRRRAPAARRAAAASPASAAPAWLPAAPPAWLPAAAPAWLPWAAVALGLAMPLAMLTMRAASGVPESFPVDDAWIHLTYARNLALHGAFTYFPGDPTTSGSTAPLFTLLEALAFRVTRNEFTVALAIGLAAHAGFLVALARWAVRRLGSPAWAAFAVALVALDGRFALLAASGMETSLFLLGVAAAFLAWSRDDARATAVALGLATWVRPEALMLGGVFAIDALIARRAPRRLTAGLVILAGLVGAYAVFNRLTGGAAFPNSLAAKAAFYAGRPRSVFLTEDVAATFGAAWLGLLPFAIVAAVRALRTPRGDSAVRAELGWALALPVAYAVVLPFSHRFNRYLVPALPAYAIAATLGLSASLARLGRMARIASFAACGVLLAVQAAYFAPALGEYSAIARYHADRHVRTGRWLASHTPETAVVATHDVGAIAFYSGRRVVDMAGLVTPEVVPHLRTPGVTAYLESLFVARGVTHLAVLNDWQAVDNVPPLFEADPVPEIMRVYAFRPGVTHLLARDVANGVAAGREALATGDVRGAAVLAARALSMDARAASAWRLRGDVARAAGQPAEAAASDARAAALMGQAPVTPSAPAVPATATTGRPASP